MKTPRFPILLVLASLPLAAGARAQTPAAGGADATATRVLDAHFVHVIRGATGELPGFGVDGVRRFRIADPAAGGTEEVRAAESEGTGRAPGVESFTVTWTPRAGFSRREGRPAPVLNGLLRVEFEFRGGGWRRSGTTMVDPAGGVVETGFQVPGRSRRRQEGFVILAPAADASVAPEAWTEAEYAALVTDMLCGEGRTTSDGSGETAFLARLPLEKIVDPVRRAKLVERLREDPPERRQRERGSRRGHPPGVAVLEGAIAGRDAEYVRFLAGDVEMLDAWRNVERWNGYWALPEVLRTGYAQCEDAARRGEIGWLAVCAHGEGSDRLAPRLVTVLAEDLRDGRAVLPGTPEERSRREREVFDLAAETEVAPPLMVLGAAAAAILLVALAARNLSRVTVF